MERETLMSLRFTHRRARALALLVATAGGGLFAGNVLATPSTPPPGLTTTILAKSTFDELLLTAKTHPADLWRAKIKTHGASDLYVVDNKLAPNATTGWHSHPGPSFIFVVAGTVTNHEGGPGCPSHAYSAGSGFVDAGGDDVHMLSNETAAPAETIAVQFLPEKAARRLDMPAPAGCTS
jgi:quercetin dioxygenase-like cupin family protein